MSSWAASSPWGLVARLGRVLKEPIPASQPVGIQDERTERIGQVIRDIMTNAQKDGFNPMARAIAKEFAWLGPEQSVGNRP